MIIYVIKRKIDKEDLNHARKLYCSTGTPTLCCKGVCDPYSMCLSIRYYMLEETVWNSKVTPHVKQTPVCFTSLLPDTTPALVSCRLVSLVSPLRTHSWASSARTRSDRRCRQNHTSGSRLHPRSSEGSHFHLHSVRAKHRKTSELQTRVSCKHSYTSLTNSRQATDCAKCVFVLFVCSQCSD
jgi:hypothetical protein